MMDFPLFTVYAMGVYQLFKALKLFDLPKVVSSKPGRALGAFLLFTTPLVLSYLTVQS